VHHYRVTWSKDGTWEKMCDRLGGLVRENEGHDEKPSAGVIDARSVRGDPTVTSPTRGCVAGKKISGRKTPGIVGTLALLIGVVVLAPSASDNFGGAQAFDRAKPKSEWLAKIFCDSGPENAFKAHCGAHHVSAEVLRRAHPGYFEKLPRRWVVERTWSWLMNNRRLQVGYERLPVVAEVFVWAAHARLLLRRLTEASDD